MLERAGACIATTAPMSAAVMESVPLSLRRSIPSKSPHCLCLLKPLNPLASVQTQIAFRSNCNKSGRSAYRMRKNLYEKVYKILLIFFASCIFKFITKRDAFAFVVDPFLARGSGAF